MLNTSFTKVIFYSLVVMFGLMHTNLNANQSIKLNAKHLKKPSAIFDKKTKTIPIPSSIILSTIKSALGGLKLHLNNHGKKHDDPNHHKSWLVQESYIEWKGKRKPFDIPELGKEVNRHKYYYYINDFNLKESDVSIQNNKLQIRFIFETDKHELKGHCLIKRRKAFGGWASCPAGSDKGAPDIDLINPELVATADVIPYKGSITIDNLNLVYKGKAKINGPLVVFSKLASDMIQKEVQKYINELVDTNDFKDTIANQIRPKLNSVHINHVVDVRIDGRNFVITYRE
jgi:hypothetical protein